MVFRWKDAKFSKMVLINFLAHSLQITILAKIWGKTAFFSKSHKNAVIRVFWHAEFISSLKIELNPMGFEKNAKNKIKYLMFIISPLPVKPGDYKFCLRLSVCQFVRLVKLLVKG